MNGRVYDPVIGRFGQADPVTESPYSTQGWNRYSYVGNSPLNFTDPSGYCFMGCFWKPLLRNLGNFLRNNPIFGAILQVAAAIICAPVGPVCSILAAAAVSTVVTGLTSGNLGMALRAGFISLVTAAMFQGIGDAIAGGLEGIAGSGLGGEGYAPPMKLGGPTQLPEVVVTPTAPVAAATVTGVGAQPGWGYGLLQGAGSIAIGYVNGVYDWGAWVGRDAKKLAWDFYQHPLDTFHYVAGGYPGGGLLTGGLKAGAGMAMLAGVGALARASKSAYSVAFEMTLRPLGQGTRPLHNFQANTALMEAMKADPGYARIMESMGIRINDMYKSPQGWAWHHVVDRPGVMQLVPEAQHLKPSEWQGVLHPLPYGGGGFSQWGAKF